MILRFIRLLAGPVITATLCGCSSVAPGHPLAEAYPAHGRITFPDRSPLKGGMIYRTRGLEFHWRWDQWWPARARGGWQGHRRRAFYL
jgi:hypothetical protein